MNETTLLVSQLAGPILVVVALGMLLNTKYLLKIYVDFGKSPFLVLFAGMSAMLLGLAIVLSHNLWSTPAEIVVSLLGWLSIAKGVMFILFSTVIIKIAKIFDKAIILVIGSVGVLAIGGYLSWVGFFA